MNSRVSPFWREPEAIAGFQTAVSLHGHTMHSEECLWFLPRQLRGVPVIEQIVRAYERGPAPGVDFSRAHWTPPLTPASALNLEREQIAGLGLHPIVSLTDHDNIEAGIGLLVSAGPREAPISVEWTVPYRRSIFHLGIHNLPPSRARQWMRDLAAFTASPNELTLAGMLAALGESRDTLIVLNHPFWLEEGVEESDHAPALGLLLARCRERIHAIELNGTRRWKENLAAIDLAKAWGLPIVSGGDRHACEPSACLNLTRAATFSEFAGEIREGQSSIVLMPQYREPMPARLMEACWEILRPYPEYPGRVRWTDRIFYRGGDGIVRKLSEIWSEGEPPIIKPVSATLQLFGNTGVRQALRYWLSRRTEVQQ